MIFQGTFQPGCSMILWLGDSQYMAGYSSVLGKQSHSCSEIVANLQVVTLWPKVFQNISDGLSPPSGAVLLFYFQRYLQGHLRSDILPKERMCQISTFALQSENLVVLFFFTIRNIVANSTQLKNPGQLVQCLFIIFCFVWFYTKSTAFPKISVASMLKFTLHRTICHPVVFLLPYSNGNCRTRCLQDLFSVMEHTLPFMFAEWAA